VVVGDVSDPLDPAPVAPPSHGRRRRVVAIVAGAAVLVTAAGAWFLLGGDPPRPVSVEEAQRRTDGATVTTAPEGEFGPPAGGVYLYRGTGTEKTSFPPLTEQQGPTMPATVTPDGPGCWRFRIDYNSHHWQDWRYCADPSGVSSTGGRTFSRRELGATNVDNTSTFTCAEPEVLLWAGMEVGEVREATCTGTSTAIDGTTTSTGPTTYVGDEDIDVGGVSVRARHLRYERELSGAQEGTDRADWWVDPETMLPIRNEHRVSIDTKLGTLTISYSEVSSYELTSLTPQRPG
jgi:hypothetical protein